MVVSVVLFVVVAVVVIEILKNNSAQERVYVCMYVCMSSLFIDPSIYRPICIVIALGWRRRSSCDPCLRGADDAHYKLP